VLLLRSASAEEWETASARAVVPLRVMRMSAGFRGSLERFDFDDGVWVVRARSGPHELARTPQLIDASAADGVLLEVNLQGRTVVHQHGRRTVIEAGDGVLFDTRRPYRLELPVANLSYLLHLPLRTLPLTESVLRAGVARRAHHDSASLALLRGYLELVLPPARVTADAQARSLATRSLVDLGAAVATGLAGGRAAASREMLLSALRVAIARDLADPDRSPATLAVRHHVSVRSVHAAFEHEGETPAAYIRARRLERARSLLRTADLRVADVALACGFREVSTFLRAFRRAHGMSPREYRAAHRSEHRRAPRDPARDAP
jgi:AraC-like DNA-binding protein